MKKLPKPEKKVDKIQIGALNCQGLKEKIDSPEILNLIEETDIFGVSETWMKTGDDISLPGFTFYPFNRKHIKGTPRGGVGIFVRDEIKKNVKIRYEMSSENLIWCKVTKDYMGYDDDLFIGFVYFPPEYSTREKKNNIDHFKQLLETVGKLKNNNIILMGDFNARTKNLDDTLSEEKHEDFPIQDFFSSIVSKRSNQDHTVNNYGRKLIEYCIATLSYIANGRTLGDLEGKFTCHQHNGSSTVDYAVIKEKIQQYVRRFQILDPSTGSDHCPIILELVSNKNDHQTKPILTNRPPPIIWNDKNKLKFVNKMNSDETHSKILEINKLISNENNNLEVIVDKINNIYDISESNNRSGEKQKKKRKKNKSKKWYDQSCSELSQRLRRTAKSLAGSPNNPHFRANFVKTKKAYRKLLKNKKIEWRKHMIQKLEQIEEKDPKEYWKLVNELREKKSSNSQYDAEKFTQFFEELFSVSEKERNDEIKLKIKEMLERIPNLPEEPDFTFEELIKAIKALKNNKAAGPDRIPAEMLT